ncbi:MAG: MarR family transcriptional regulator [Actinomycetota bacterium]|nr:MarR family transcriptional regulator [Acidimicrobiia bacterium]MDQ3294484.1 MarR family transcriptional regulator [Actinomycetota bacterium]
MSSEVPAERITYAGATTAVLRAHRLVTQRVETVLAPLGLTMARFEVLGLLNARSDGELSFTDLKRVTLMHPATMGHTIRKLEADGLLRRRPDTVDGRAQVAVLTRRGRTLADRGTRALDAIRFGLEDLDEAGARRLDRQLSELRR